MKGKQLEQALSEIEHILEAMESGEMPLEESLKQYEKGMKLIKYCSRKLEDAEKKLKIIERDLEDNPRERDFEEHSREDGTENVESFRKKTARASGSGRKKKTVSPVSPGEAESDPDMELGLF
jgi:exodeoxyribonuclease VII small subunit